MTKYLHGKKIGFIIAANTAIFFVLIGTIYGQAIRNFNSLYIGLEGDSSYYIWITKWFSQFFSHPNLLHITNVFYPIGIDISAGWEGSILFYVGGFFNLFFSEAASYNLLILFPVFLNWIVIYFVFYKFSGRLFLSGLFSTLFCTGSFFIARSLGHPSYLYFFHIPLLFYFLRYEWLKDLNLKKSLLLATIYVLISITSWYYFIFAAIITAVYLVNFAINTGRPNFTAYKKITLTYLGVLLAVIIFNFPMFKAFFFGSSYFYPYPFKMNNAELNQLSSMHVIEYFKPSTLNILYSAQPSWQVGSVEKILFPGIAFYFLLIISFVFVLKKKVYKKYIVLGTVGLIFIVFSLGYNSPLPLYKILNSLPIASTLHTPGRFGIIAVFAGWLFVARASRYFSGRWLMSAITILIALQIYETSYFKLPFENFDSINILKKINATKKTPILELPVRYSASGTLLIPALTNRPIFSGYPQHTTYSPQFDYYILNNVLDSLASTEKAGTDVVEELTPSETAAYLKWKFGVEDVVLNKKERLNSKTSELMKYFRPVAENEAYAIYDFKNIPVFENKESLKIVTGSGVGKFMDKRRSLAEKSQFDVLNFSDNPQKIKLHFDLAPLDPRTNYFVEANSLKKDITIIANPGLNTLFIEADKKCAIQGADCVTGTISQIIAETTK